MGVYCMIKLIASDVDGTILQHGRQMPTEEMYNLIQNCKDRGIIFAIASGRQYPNLQRMFRRVGDGLLYICENGALLVRDDQVLHSAEISKGIGKKLIREIQETPHNEVLVCGKNSCYIAPKRLSYLRDLALITRNTITVFDDPDVIDEPWLKISAFQHNGDATRYLEMYKKRWGHALNVVQSGNEWVDFGTTSKGEAVEFIKNSLGLSPDETAGIGDNGNDVSMFQAVSHSFVIASASAEVRAQARYTVENPEQAVRQILTEF